jgi:nanoRNase/pAp phosphatase (c-di-AMP/oligoRNAs hydrolase)
MGDEGIGRPRAEAFGFGGFPHFVGGDEAAAGAELYFDLLFDPV